MAGAFEGGLKKGADTIFSYFFADYPSPKCQDVCVVVLPRQARRAAVVTEGRAYSVVAIGGNGYSDPRSTNEDSLLRRALCNGLCHRRPIIGVIHRVRGVGSQVHDLIALRTHMLRQDLLKGESGVIGRQRDRPL